MNAEYAIKDIISQSCNVKYSYYVLQGHQNRVQTDGAVAGRSGANPNVRLWSGVVRTQAGGHELIFPSQSYEQPKRMHSQPTSLHHQSQQHRIPIPAPHVMSVAPPVTPQREGHQSGPPSRVSSINHPPGTPVYTNLIPAYYIPHDGSSLASGAGAFLMSPLGAGVQGNSFLHQSPVQYIQSAPPSAVILQPMGPAHQLAPQTMTPSTSGMVVQPPDASRPDPVSKIVLNDGEFDDVILFCFSFREHSTVRDVRRLLQPVEQARSSRTLSPSTVAFPETSLILEKVQTK